MAAFPRPRRLLIAVEMEDGSATVYQLHGNVTVAPVEDEVTWGWDYHERRTKVVAEGSFLEIMHHPASDYFDDQPAIGLSTPAIGPGIS